METVCGNTEQHSEESMRKLEYSALKQEIKERVSISNSLSATAIQSIIPTWAAGFAFFAVVLGNNGKLKLSENLILAGVILIFLIPVVYFVPLAKKSGENLLQLVSLSAYIRVFYEFPSTKQKENMINWESSNYFASNNGNVLKGGTIPRAINAEYVVLSGSSYGIALFIAIYMFLNLESPIFKNILIGLTIGVTIVSTLLIRMIYIDSSISHRMSWPIQKAYIDEYTERAYKLGYLTSEEKEQARKALYPEFDCGRSWKNSCINIEISPDLLQHTRVKIL